MLLKTEARCRVREEDILRNVRSALARGHPELEPRKKKGTPVALVGGGPSLVDFLDELRDWDGPIMALNGAHDHLISQGIYPTHMALMDARARQARFVRNICPTTLYMPCTTCDPTVFDVLEVQGAKIMVWNAEFHCGPRIARNRVSGGSTIGMRAVNLLLVMGYNNIHMFGFDGCLKDDKHHAYPQPRVKLDEIHQVWAYPDRKWKCTPPMCAQAGDFKNQLKFLGSLYDFTFHGEGLLHDIWRRWLELSAGDGGSEHQHTEAGNPKKCTLIA